MMLSRKRKSAVKANGKRRKTGGLSKLEESEETRTIVIGRPEVLQIDTLPDAVILSIIEKLDMQQVVALARTCRRFHALSLSQSIWRAKCKVRGP